VQQAVRWNGWGSATGSMLLHACKHVPQSLGGMLTKASVVLPYEQLLPATHATGTTRCAAPHLDACVLKGHGLKRDVGAPVLQGVRALQARDTPG
jgi:hypothetical protein